MLNEEAIEYEIESNRGKSLRSTPKNQMIVAERHETILQNGGCLTEVYPLKAN
jgi:hypothetical protein